MAGEPNLQSRGHGPHLSTALEVNGGSMQSFLGNLSIQRQSGFLFHVNYCFVYIYVYVRVSDPLEVDLEAAMWLLKIEHGSSGRAASPLNH